MSPTTRWILTIAATLSLLPPGVTALQAADGRTSADAHLKIWYETPARIFNDDGKATAARDGYLAAICAAPMVLGKRGLLKGKRAICFPGFEKFLDGAILSNRHVVRDGKTVTAAGMGVALDFGLELVAMLCGDVAAENLRASIIAG